MLALDVSIAALAARKRAGGVQDWPENSVAVWLIFGQSNAEGYAPWAQDPARSDPANAIDALTGAERAVHDWVRFSVRGSGVTAGRFEKQGIATDTSPRTSGLSGKEAGKRMADRSIPLAAPDPGSYGRWGSLLPNQNVNG